jgi:hypothetical protein
VDFKKHLETAWHLTLSNIAPLILMTLAMAVVCTITLGILAPVTLAGYMQAILLLLRERREPAVMDIFSQMRLFVPLFLFGVATVILVMIGLFLLVLPGLFIALAISYCCLYMIPLMTDQNLALVDAIKESARMTLKGNVAEHVAIFIIFFGISAVGGSVFIGFLFTQPLATLFLLSTYEEEVGNTVPVATTNPQA